jgi:hypothetical protein
MWCFSREHNSHATSPWLRALRKLSMRAMACARGKNDLFFIAAS